LRSTNSTNTPTAIHTRFGIAQTSGQNVLVTGSVLG
jgi:hypothetical protein